MNVGYMQNITKKCMKTKSPGPHCHQDTCPEDAVKWPTGHISRENLQQHMYGDSQKQTDHG